MLGIKLQYLQTITYTIGINKEYTSLNKINNIIIDS